MSVLKIWFMALLTETAFLLLGYYLEYTNASLGTGIAVGLTQLPGSYLSGLLVSTASTLWLFDILMYVIQVLVFGIALHLIVYIMRLVARAKQHKNES